MDAEDTAQVAIAAAKRLYGDGAEVPPPKKLAGGAVHDSWAVDATVGGKTHELVVRTTPPGRRDYEKTRREFEVLRAAFKRGVRCPEPIAVGGEEVGADYLVMARVRGDTNPRQLLTNDAFAAARKAMIPQLAEDLARIHTLTAADVADAPGMRGPEGGEDGLRYMRRSVEENYRHDLLNPHPALEWAFRWIDRQIAALPSGEREPCVVHGDFRIGNMLYDEGGLTSVLDWEGTHLGEPEEDLAWLCTRVWRFSRPDLEAGGLASREEWIQAYERAAQRPISRERVAAWEVLQNIRWCQITMMQAKVHLDGNQVSHELAAIGRRTAETELEVLRLTGVVERMMANAG
ncbi:MAG: phosphotransferase family protein [Hyphomicrobiales bacterium]